MEDELMDIRSQFEASWSQMTAQLYGGSESLFKGIRYSCQGPGKRVRPLLLLLGAKSLGASIKSSMAAAIAVEMIHCYSLVHDDLPSMDDDDFRRGRPTTHKVFSEATAILVGDALLTDAFLWISQDPFLSDRQKISLIRELSGASGSQGMVLGQGLDMDMTEPARVKTLESLNRIHSLKTGSLLSAALSMAAFCADRPDLSEKMGKAGSIIGLAFQILDDLLDDSQGTGKSPGKDKAQNKLTYLSFYSRDEALSLAKQWTEEAKTILIDLGMINELVSYLDLLLKREL